MIFERAVCVCIFVQVSFFMMLVNFSCIQMIFERAVCVCIFVQVSFFMMSNIYLKHGQKCPEFCYIILFTKDEINVEARIHTTASLRVFAYPL